MDHTDATASDHRDLPSRYLRGELDAAEESAFEAHFVDCPACLDELELARDFARDVRATALADAARQVMAGRLLRWWLSRPAGRRRALVAGLVGGLALLVAGPAWWLGRQNRQLAEQVAQQAAANAAGEAATGQLERRLREAEVREQQAAAALAAREAQLQAPPERPPEPPQANLPVFLLALVRGGPAAEPVEIAAPRAGSFALALDPGPASARSSFRVQVFDASNRRVYQQADLRPNALDVLMVVFPAGFLAPGRYHLELAEADGAAWRERGRWPFTLR